MWLEKGFTFHVHWANGPHGSFKRILRKVLPKYNPDALYPARNPPEMYIGSGPELHVYTLGIEGPFYEEWPLAGFDRYFPSPPVSPNAEYLRSSLTRLANAAFRRPVTEQEIKPYLDLAERYLAENKDLAAARYGMRAILTSPRFLYLNEHAPHSAGHKLDGYELASRLSYFLWSSMPDNELRAAAASGLLKTPEGLRGQVTRMLRDPRASALSKNFVEQWLHLRTLGEMPPDPETNRAYYEDDLENAMREETRRYFAHVLQQNRSIQDFIDSDYTFLNEPLARHYGIPGISIRNFASSTETRAPTRRPAWAWKRTDRHLQRRGNSASTTGRLDLENLLGTPPSPPPPDIEPIEPDVRGVSTIRELMEKHRNNATCFECHRKIDPLDWQWNPTIFLAAGATAMRRRFPSMPQVTCPMERPSTVPSAFVTISKRPAQFTRCLTEKLWVYAMGRRISFTDRDDIDRIVAEMPEHRHGLRELVQKIVASEPFHSK